MSPFMSVCLFLYSWVRIKFCLMSFLISTKALNSDNNSFILVKKSLNSSCLLRSFFGQRRTYEVVVLLLDLFLLRLVELPSVITDGVLDEMDISDLVLLLAFVQILGNLSEVSEELDGLVKVLEVVIDRVLDLLTQGGL